jgi:hypothetical protein
MSIDSATGQAVATTTAAGNPAAIAEQYLGWYESDLERVGVTHRGVPPDESCANFVSSMLARAGMIAWWTANVSDLDTRLRAEGWGETSHADARPGSVWICNGSRGESHTELVAANNQGRITLVGSNNHPNPNNQQINYDSYSANIPGSFILHHR